MTMTRVTHGTRTRAAATAIAAGAVTALLLAGRPAAAQILSVDFGLNTPSPVQAGFSAFNLANPGVTANPSQTFTGLSGVASGQITLTFGGTPGGRDRGQPNTGGAPDLFRDLFTALAETATGTTFSVTGLNPNTSYSVEIWSLDRGFNNGAVYEWYNTTAGSTLLGTIVNSTTAVPASLNEFRVTGTVTADATGRLAFGHVDPVGTGTINGFRISAAAAAVPEPSSVALAAVGVLPLLGSWNARRRRRTL
jgi:hypothetical protein